MSNFFIKIAEACSIEYGEPVQKTFEFKSLVIKEGFSTLHCKSYTTISPFPLTVIIGIFIYILINKLRTVQKKWVKVFGWILIIILILFFLQTILSSIALFI
jgi:hypothetical protein